MMKRIILAIAAVSLLGGCGVFKGGNRKVTPTVGQRVSVLNTEASIEVDPSLAAMPVTLPGAITNAEWAQAGGNASHSMGHLTLGASIGQAWRVSAPRTARRSGRPRSAARMRRPAPCSAAG